MTKYNFTFEEKKQALEKKGYRIEKHTIKVWNQWGKHDGETEWEDFSAEFALIGDNRPHLYNTVQEAFNSLLRQKEQQDRLNFLNSL